MRSVTLLRSSRDVRTVFDLLGDKENDMTFSLGWLLAISSAFRHRLLSDIVDYSLTGLVEHAVIRLQTGRVGHGITDIEVDCHPRLAVIFEAKKGPQLPSLEQLSRYGAVLATNPAPERHLVALTNATPEYASLALPGTVGGIPLHHKSWRQIRQIALGEQENEGYVARRWLMTFCDYLEGLLQMETKHSNWTYVVSLATGNPNGWPISWIDIVTQRSRYFYPVGSGGWPDPPPNYMAFRYWASLQSIHHVDSFEIMTNPQTVFPDAPSELWEPYYCLKLGPAIKPPRPVPAGPRVKQAARVWCMLDTLLTSASISDALTESKRRNEAV
jgi:hypothetical protein